MLAGEVAVGHDIEFFSLDLANTVWTRCLYCAAGTLLVYWQMNDLELPTMEPVVRAVCRLAARGRIRATRVGVNGTKGRA